jgi:hypothetical protein
MMGRYLHSGWGRWSRHPGSQGMSVQGNPFGPSLTNCSHEASKRCLSQACHDVLGIIATDKGRYIGEAGLPRQGQIHIA